MENENHVVAKNSVLLHWTGGSAGYLQCLFPSLVNSGRERAGIQYGRPPLVNNRAFTLIELLVVVLIIGILAAVALPQYKLAVLKARLTQAKVMVNALAKAEEVYYLANGAYSPTMSALDIDTPQASEEVSALTSNTRTFKWGSCWVADDVYGARAVCNINDEIKLYKFLRHSSVFANYNICHAMNTDLNSPQNKLCKQESGRTNASGCIGTSHCEWYYL